MIEIGIFDAKEKFVELLNKVESGEEVVIKDSGKRVAKIIPIKRLHKKRVLGLEKGKIKVHGDFNSPLPDEIINRFYQ